MHDIEVWKDIPGYEGLYKASSFGSIKTLERSYKVPNNAVRTIKERELKPWMTADGYKVLELNKNSITKTFTVHRAIAITFIPNPNNYETVNHINGNKLDNRIENLEWCTRLENYRHAQDTGLFKYKITNEDILKIKELYKTKEYSQREIGQLYGLHQCFISRIVNNKRRKRAHLSKI